MDTHTSLQYDMHVNKKMKEKLSAVEELCCSTALSPSSALEEELQRNDSPIASKCTASTRTQMNRLLTNQLLIRFSFNYVVKSLIFISLAI